MPKMNGLGYSIKAHGYKYFKKLFPESLLTKEDYYKIYYKILDSIEDDFYKGAKVCFFSIASIRINATKRNFNKLSMKDVNWVETKKQNKFIYHLDDVRNRMYVEFTYGFSYYRMRLLVPKSRKISECYKNGTNYPIILLGKKHNN